MKPSAIVLQWVCVALGVAFCWAAFALSTEVLWGGLLIGSVMFMAAALLGVDPTSNPDASPRRRRFYRVMAVLAVVPIFCTVVYSAVQFAGSGRWMEVVGALLKLSFLAILMAGLAFERHPVVRRWLRGVGVKDHDVPADAERRR